jgi:hypothetical protein
VSSATPAHFSENASAHVHTKKKATKVFKKTREKNGKKRRKEEDNGHPNTLAKCISRERNTARARIRERALSSFSKARPFSEALLH